MPVMVWLAGQVDIYLLLNFLSGLSLSMPRSVRKELMAMIFAPVRGTILASGVFGRTYLLWIFFGGF